MRGQTTVPEDWAEPKWTQPFNRRELAYLIVRLDASNTALRIVNRKLAAKLEEKTS
ncbi:hypothetical protein SPF06_02525 [Sinomonas sp. JGH33]|uniref:Uncharacterized protein n=1 Tax=Sinomonas terricola TaxID=3110330 RepID=A0ABU5T1Q6_9MICC|nr:hypothetical protein [Sinomonas sp. JGH33]MEA5453588.1 hypothetical protein [Sinomonas sp. JGH33]